MPTSSITKDFHVKDPAAFERLKQELDKPQQSKGKRASGVCSGVASVKEFTFREA